MPPRAQQIQTVEDYDLENPNPQDDVGGITDITDADIEDITDAQIERTADPMLQMQHKANVRAEAAAYKPGWLETLQTQGPLGLGKEMVKDFGAAAAGTPRRWAEMATGVPQLVMQTLGGKGAQVGTELIKGATEPLISPRTTGKAVAEGLIDTAALGVASRAAPAAGRLAGKAKMRISPTVQQAADIGTNQLVAGLHPKNIKTARAVKSARADINEYMQRTGQDFTDSASFRDLASGAADDFYTGNYKPLADSLNGVPVQHQGALRPFEQLIERRGEINKTLGRLGYFDKSPLSRSLARTQPQVQKLVEELDDIKLTVNQAVDQMAPTNEGAAKILRRYADMKEVSDIAKAQADKLELQKMIEAGAEEPWTAQLGEWLKDAGVTAATFGTNPKLVQRWWNMVRSDRPTSALKREKYFARGSKNWAKGRKAIVGEHKPIQRLSAAPPPTVTNVPMAPQSAAPVQPTPQQPIFPGSQTAPPAQPTKPISGLNPQFRTSVAPLRQSFGGQIPIAPTAAPTPRQASIQFPGQPPVPAPTATPAPAPYQAQYYPPSPLIAKVARGESTVPVPPVQPSPMPSIVAAQKGQAPGLRYIGEEVLPDGTVADKYGIPVTNELGTFESHFYLTPGESLTDKLDQILGRVKKTPRVR